MYSYRLGRRVALLTDDEYEQVAVHLASRIGDIMKYKKEHGCSIEEAKERAYDGQKAMDAYEAITGVRLDHPDQLFAMSLSNYGRPCPSCSKPFRTPRAKLCAACGFRLPQDEVAGPASDT